MLLTPASHCFRTLAIVAAVAIAVGLVAPASANQAAATGPATAGAEGFVPIFNGRDFSGWTGAVDNYEVKDGALMCRPGQGGTLYTVAEYSDFIVQLEFNLPPGGNNGLAIRYPGKGDAAYAGMTELQVLDDPAPKYATLDPRQMHGSAYGMVASRRGHLKPVGEWNVQVVTVQGSTHPVVDLNGTRILDADLSKVATFHEPIVLIPERIGRRDISASPDMAIPYGSGTSGSRRSLDRLGRLERLEPGRPGRLATGGIEPPN